MTQNLSIDDLGASVLVQPANTDTNEVHAQLLASWAAEAQKRATTFDRTARRKADFHRKRLDALADGSASSGTKRETAERAVAHWEEQQGRGEELVERLIEGLRLLPETPIAQVASWAVWEERDDSDAHWYQHGDQLTALTAGTEVPQTGAIFIGLNTGDTGAPSSASEKWDSFHGSPRDGVESERRGTVHNLADHLRATPLWGSYMTSFYKNLPSVDEQVLKALLDTASAPDKKAMTTLMGLIIRDEASVFGLDPATTTGLALGGRAANLARTSMRDWAGIVEMPHYAASIKAEAFRDAIDNSLAALHPGVDPRTPLINSERA